MRSRLLPISIIIGCVLFSCAKDDNFDSGYFACFKNDDIDGSHDNTVDTNGTKTAPVTYSSDVYHLTSSEIQNGMSASSYGNIRFADWCKDGGSYTEYEINASGIPNGCHTQGNSVRGDRLVVACQGKDGDEPSGWVQSFYKDGSGPIGDARSLCTVSHNHPNVGNGITVTADGSADDLYPIVNAGTGDYVSSSTYVQFRKYSNNRSVCSFSHDIHDGYGRSSLGAVSAVAFNSVTYIAACGYNCDEFYIYRIDHPESGDCGATLVSTLIARGDHADASSIGNAGSGDTNWGLYNGVALIKNHLEQVFMIGTHQKFMDTWRLDNFGTSTPTYQKLSKFKWVGAYPQDGNYYFEQGLSIEYVGQREYAIWFSPHDYDGSFRLYRCKRDF
jgi:hypothetical protein